MTGNRTRWFRGLRVAVTMTVVSGGVNACAGAAHAPASPASASGTPPSYVLGSFVDDYGGRHTISASEWTQGDDDRCGIIDGREGGHAAERLQWLSVHTNARARRALALQSEASNGDRDLLSEM